MQTRSTKGSKTKPAVVEFSNLTQNNKAEFLEFLLKNNIVFERGEEIGRGDYIAKVIIQKPDQNKENAARSEKPKIKTDSKQSCKKTSFKSMMDSQKSIKVTTPMKQHNKEIEKQAPSSFKNVESRKQVSSNPNSKSQKKGLKTVKITQFLARGSKTDFSGLNFNCKHQQRGSLVSKQKPKVQSSRLEKKQIKKRDIYKDLRQSNEKTIPEIENEYNKSPSWAKKEATQKQKQKISQINNQVKKKTEEQKQIFELVNKYLKRFDLRLLGQRPIKWSVLQLHRAMEEIYNELFIKTTHSLTQKGMACRELQNTSQSFVKFIKEWYLNKYKNQKLANSNLINLLYSLSFYLENEKKLVSLPRSYVKEVKANQRMTSSGSFMQTFEDFISEIYQFDDLLFFLFIRNITLSEAGKQARAKDNLRGECHEKDIQLNYKEFVRILSAILDEDTELIEEYKIMILTRLNSKVEQQSGLEQDVRISGLDFMMTLVQNYHIKRLQNHQTIIIQSKGLAKTIAEASKTALVKLQNDHQLNLTGGHQVETEELTFGEQTQENIQKFLEYQTNQNYCKEFWETEDGDNILSVFQQGSLEALIRDKMGKKVTEFVNILIENRSEYNSIESKKIGNGDTMGSFHKNYIIELFMRKSMNLLGCIVEMNKLKWFEQLKLKNPSPEDIEKVENLQLAYRKLKAQPDSEKIGKLCKNILTVSQLTYALEKLICQ